MKVSIIPTIRYFGEVIDYGNGMVYDKDILIQTKPFTMTIKNPPARVRRRGGYGSVRPSEAQLKTYITNRIKSSLKRRLDKTIKSLLYTDISAIEEDNDTPNSPPIKFYLNDYPEAMVNRPTFTQAGFDKWVEDNFFTEFRIVRTSSQRANRNFWGQERVWLKAPPSISYDRTCYFENTDSGLTCAYDYLYNTYKDIAGFKKLAKNKDAIDKCVRLPLQHHKDIYREWETMYQDDIQLEKYLPDKLNPLPDIVDIEDIQDDLYKVIDMDLEYRYSKEDKKETLSILDIIKWGIVANVRVLVLDYDNTYYCSYNPNTFKATHNEVKTNNRRTIALKVAHDHAYFITDADIKRGLSISETLFTLEDAGMSYERSKKSKLEDKDEEDNEIDIHYHLHPINDVEISGEAIEFYGCPNDNEGWNKLKLKLLGRQNLCRDNPPPTIKQLKEWMFDKGSIHHYSVNSTNLNKLVSLLYKTYQFVPTNLTGGLCSVNVATYGCLKIYSRRRRPKGDEDGKLDKLYELYPDLKSKYGIEPTSTKIANEVYNKLELPNILSMYNGQTRRMFYDAEVKPINRKNISKGEHDFPVYSFDVSKAYTTTIETNTKYKWNVFDSVCQPQKFNGKVYPSYFYLCKNLTTEYPCKEGKGLVLYHGSYLQHLKGKVLPKYYIKPIDTLEPDHFKPFVDKIKDEISVMTDIPFKELINCFIGNLKRKDGITEFKHYITQSKYTANREVIRNKTPTRLDTSTQSWRNECLLIATPKKQSHFQTAQPIRLQVIDMINEQMLLFYRHYRVCLLNWKFAFNWVNNIKQRKVLQKIRNKKSVPSKSKGKFILEPKLRSVKTDALYITMPYRCPHRTENQPRLSGFGYNEVEVMNEKLRVKNDKFSKYLTESWNRDNEYKISLENTYDDCKYSYDVAVGGKSQLSFKFIPNVWNWEKEVSYKWRLKETNLWKKKLLEEGGMIEGKGGRGKSELINEIKDIMDRNRIRYKWMRGIYKILKVPNLYEALAEWRIKNPCFYKCWCPTNKSANRVGGTTFHRGLGIPFKEDKDIEEDEVDEDEKELEDTNTICYMDKIIATLEGCDYESKSKKKKAQTDILVVDEVSMVGGKILSYLAYIKQRIPRIRFIVAGDIPHQLPPVKEEKRNFKDSYCLKEICGFNYIKLNYNFRMNTTKDELWDNWSCNPNQFKIETSKRPTYRNLCYTNITRKKVIQAIQDTLKNPRVLVCHHIRDFQSVEGQTKELKLGIGTPLIARKSIKEYKIAKNEMYYVCGLKEGVVEMYEPELKKNIEVEDADVLKWFLSGFCITIHKSQGETYRDKYTIWEWSRLSEPQQDYTKENFYRRLRYVAQSRSTDPINNISYR